MQKYVLQIDRNEDEMSWGFIPNSLWKIILRDFVQKHADGLGFDGILHGGDLSQIFGLEQWNPNTSFRCEILTSFLNKQNNRISVSRKMAVFPYIAEAKHVLQNVDFDQWKSYNVKYPIDYLYLFKGHRILMEAIPFESTLVFYLDSGLYTELIQLDQLLKDNLRVPQNNPNVEVRLIE